MDQIPTTNNHADDVRRSLDQLNIPVPNGVSYGSYLKVRELLSLQQCLSTPPEHDELLFIQIHQVYELWFKQILHEVTLAETCLKAGRLMSFQRTLRRILTIQSVLTHQVDVLETMTPVDFNRFRNLLNPASGFQSWQFRELEFRLGAKEPAYLKFHHHDAFATQKLTDALAASTLYDAFIHLLARRSFPIAPEVLERDVTVAYESQPSVAQAVLAIYQDPDRHYDLYTALEALIDLDEGILLWRQRHVVMVERMIGSRKGTGGSSGVRYLNQTLNKRLFPEIWEARNWLGTNEYGNSKAPSKDPKQTQ
jgi:tryptophan 2,3-dioxygenase